MPEPSTEREDKQIINQLRVEKILTAIRTMTEWLATHDADKDKFSDPVKQAHRELRQKVGKLIETGEAIHRSVLSRVQTNHPPQPIELAVASNNTSE